MTREEIRKVLKSEVEKAVALRREARAVRGAERGMLVHRRRLGRPHRRALNLALSYLNGTAYGRVESAPATVPPIQWIADLLDGVTREAVARWVQSKDVPARVPESRRPSRLYAVVRADLPPGAQAVQSAHALREFAEQYPEIEKAWHAGSNTLAVLAVPSEPALATLVSVLREQGIALAEFREPDLGNALTAICVEPRAGRLLRDLPLALSSAASAAA